MVEELTTEAVATLPGQDLKILAEVMSPRHSHKLKIHVYLPPLQKKVLLVSCAPKPPVSYGLKCPSLEKENLYAHLEMLCLIYKYKKGK